MLKRSLIVLSAVLVTSFSAFAGTESLDWLIQLGGGYTWTVGPGGVLTGTDVAVVDVSGENTPANPGGQIQFLATLTETSPLYLGADTGGVSTTQYYALGGPGTFTICLTADGCTTGELLSGTLSAVTETTNLLIPSLDQVQGTISSAVISGLVIPTNQGNKSIAQYFGMTGATFLSGTMQDYIVPPTLTGTGPDTSTYQANNTGSGSVLVTYATTPEGWSLSSSLGVFAIGLALFTLARRFGLLKTLNF
jgi:hypothetical protein